MFGRVILSVIVFFFFMQKTSYEMRISDWSSDVCSSDLASRDPMIEAHNAWLDAVGLPLIEQIRTARSVTRRRCADRKRRSAQSPQHGTCELLAAQNGRAELRERVGQLASS